MSPCKRWKFTYGHWILTHQYLWQLHLIRIFHLRPVEFLAITAKSKKISVACTLPFVGQSPQKLYACQFYFMLQMFTADWFCPQPEVVSKVSWRMEDWWCHGWQGKCFMDNVKEWTSLPKPELLTGASCWKRLEGDLGWFITHVPPATQSVMELNWTEK